VALASLDAAAIFCAYLVPLVLRYEGNVPARQWRQFLVFLPVALASQLLSNYVLGLYGQMWRYASVQEARRVLLAGMLGAVVTVIGGTAVARELPLPVSVVLLGPTLVLLGIGAVRFQSRLFGSRRRAVDEDPSRVLLVGAGDAGSMVLKDILRNSSLDLVPVGLVDDDPRKVGRSMHGIPVVGNRQAIPRLVQRLRVDQVLLTIPSATSDVVRDVASLCEKADVMLRVLPAVRETVGGRVSVRDVRDVSIEDLLGRQQVQTDLDAVATLLRGRRVLITGAGGSIGSEIVRQVAACEPASLVLLDHDETHLHDAHADLQSSKPAHGTVIDLTDPNDDRGVHLALVDIRDQDRVLWTFMKHRPEIVFHAAAHKHVPVLENHPAEAMLTNVLGTANVVDAAVATGVARFVLISTDKAIHPINVMGASKRLAEQIGRSIDRDCVFCAVRFGNVVGSRGSVIPTFFRQVERGGPVTVTDPTMTRYFMSVQEAVQLVLQAAALSNGGEVFTLDMGEPVNVLELARRIIRLAGRVPGKDIEIAIIGPRPGEKIAEDVIDLDEERLPSGHPSIVVSRPPTPDRAALRSTLHELENLAVAGRNVELAARMKALAGSLVAARVPALEER
jgi:FlaA1/EpsC-like NDP-sugar epimerase